MCAWLLLTQLTADSLRLQVPQGCSPGQGFANDANGNNHAKHSRKLESGSLVRKKRGPVGALVSANLHTEHSQGTDKQLILKAVEKFEASHCCRECFRILLKVF
jgi:hypothetical protein